MNRERTTMPLRKLLEMMLNKSSQSTLRPVLPIRYRTYSKLRELVEKNVNPKMKERINQLQINHKKVTKIS